MTRPPAVPLPPEPIVGPGELKSSPFYWPNLIAALAASIAIAIGSIGPWIAFMGMSRNNIGSGADGTITLALGIVATLALFALLNFGRTQVRVGRMVGLGTVAGIAGVIAFLIALIDAQAVSSRKAEIFGTTIGPEIGWGLWMILIAGPVLAITSAIVVKQVKKIAKAPAVPGVAAAPSPTAAAKPAVPPPPPPPPPPAPAPIVETKPEPAPPPPPPAPTPARPPVPAPLAAVPAEPPLPPAASAKPPTPPLPPPPVTVAAKSPKAPRAERSGIRRAAPWAGGAAALVAALAAGVWAGPHLTGANRSDTAEPSAAATSTSTTPSSAAPSTTQPATPTTSATPPAASGSPTSAPATFGPFTSGGDAKVTVGGQPREVRGDISCLVYSGKTNISIGPIGNPVGAAITDADSRVSSVTLGTVDDVMLAYLDGAADGNATATRDGKSYRITGTASGFDPKNPMQPYTRSFEINVTCP
jgi:lipoprotein LpqH